jgi:hypothetical protein
LETIRDFHTRFETLLQKILTSHHPANDFIVYIYTKDFTGQIGYLLKDKNLQTIHEAQELATKIEDNLHSSKIEPFSNPRVKMDTKPKIVHNVEPSSYICASLERFQMTMDGMMKNQELMMYRIINLERAQCWITERGGESVIM